MVRTVNFSVSFISRRATLKRLVTTSLIFSSLCLSGAHGASTTNKGANPNGKPFVQVAGEIFEVHGEVSTVRDQVDSLVAHVEGLENRVSANETGIAELRAANLALQTQLDENDDVLALQAKVTQLEGEVQVLQAQMNDHEDGSLQSQIDINNSVIYSLKLTIGELSTLGDQILNNSELIGVMQNQVETLTAVATQQYNIVNGVCPEGETVSWYVEGEGFSCYRRIEEGDVEVAYPVEYKSVTIPKNGTLTTNPICGNTVYPFTETRYPRNFGYTQTGGIVFMSMRQDRTFYEIKLRNDTNVSQVMNMEWECHSSL
jgi:hypothetical protein